jgi:hypothetical protein
MTVLNGKYRLVKPIHQLENLSITETWLGNEIEKNENEYLIRLWPYNSTKIQRALWNNELRKLYRVSSSPGAGNFLLILKDAGIDENQQCFVMVMFAKGHGYTPLNQLLRSRSSGTWPNTRSLEVRKKIWLGLLKIIYGVDILHSQNVLHRNISAENVFLHPAEVAESFLLGGFEWSIRISEYLHEFAEEDQLWPINRTTRNTSVFGFEDDWYAFGLLAARCLLNVESCYIANRIEVDDCVRSDISSATSNELTDLEKTLLLRLTSPDHTERLVYSYHIINEIQEILKSLDMSISWGDSKPTLVLTYNQDQCEDLRGQAVRSGWVLNPDDSSEEFNPNELTHLQSLNEFLQKDFQKAQIYYYREDQHILLGENMCLIIRKLRLYDNIAQDYIESWDAAFAAKTAYLYTNPDLGTMQSIPAGAIVVMPIRKFREVQNTIKNRRSWQQYLPTAEVGLELGENMRRFYDFVICLNQLELLFRDAELFGYMVKRREIHQQFETIVITECPRERSPIDMFVPSGGLIEHIQNELAKGDLYSNLVVLAPLDNGSLRIPEDLEPGECYEIISINKDEGSITLRKALRHGEEQVPDSGWIKAFGMRGQLRVIRRRQQAIYRLRKHTYLLKSLIATGQTFIDTGLHQLPMPVPVERIDDVKQAVMQDILRTRPIYALHGPPGTGKTTLVAHLVRQIIADDPVAQVLITAQAHGAVNVLQRKVVDDAFADVSSRERPLAVRLGIRNNEEKDVSISLLNVSKNILDQVLQGLQDTEELSDLQLEWQDYVQALRLTIKTTHSDQEHPNEIAEFLELVKRSASIVYSTTNAGDLEVLSRNMQQFDWSIIEEAGKCLVFDLALPMQLGHRWLLIGDWKQLPPYRIEAYQDALSSLPQMITALKGLPDRAGGILDIGWIERWEALSLEAQQDFVKISLGWVEAFKKIFEICEVAPDGPRNPPRRTSNQSVGASAGVLTGQYRMHPTLGTLISRVYYDNELINRTIDETSGYLSSHVSLRLESPFEFQGTSLVWIDTSVASENSLAQDDRNRTGPSTRYVNWFEAFVIKEVLKSIKLESGFLREIQDKTESENPLTLSILSPYKRQVDFLSKGIGIDDLPSGLRPQTELVSDSSENTRLVHTVDSFQGNEADIVIISMVRNNQLASSDRNPLGFLTKENRMNVLLSRARRLMILVGNWKFFHDCSRMYSSSDPDLPGWHLAISFSLLDQWFQDGKALRIPSSKFVD